ncbi:MAG: CUB domain-containing protein [Bacteroidetes bacterium]|nr:CUB domain-containing protein [Bacteroidota bacterium]
MEKIRLLVTFLILTLCTNVAIAQNYNISNSNVSTCSGNFFDSNGPAGNYFNNENYVMTFCSSVSGECVRLSFSAFELENGYDFLTVYNGPNTSSPILGTFTGTNLPGLLTATSGCLTIEFTSDFTGRDNGWEASLSCVPCPASNCPSCNGGAPPANDACASAMNLGALPAPAACPNGVGAWTNINTTNICATAESPYTTLTGCQPVGNMASPAADVWYRFNITGPTLNINIAGMQTPNIGLYAGNNCGNLVGRGCAIGGGGILTPPLGDWLQEPTISR